MKKQAYAPEILERRVNLHMRPVAQLSQSGRRRAALLARLAIDFVLQALVGHIEEQFRLLVEVFPAAHHITEYSTSGVHHSYSTVVWV